MSPPPGTLRLLKAAGKPLQPDIASTGHLAAFQFLLHYDRGVGVFNGEEVACGGCPFCLSNLYGSGHGSGSFLTECVLMGLCT